MSTNTLTVELGERSYPIFIGENLFDNKQSLTSYLGASQIAIVTNDTLAPLYLEQLRERILAANPHAKIIDIVLPDGEQYKTLESISHIYDVLLEHRFNRKALVVAFGGGVVGDMAGFAAATYQRGVPFVQVPTTLLSQVDSSVGGKTGVNHPLGKNMIGAFYQPEAVFIDTQILASLPDRELSAGLAEVIKYGLIADEEFLTWLEANIDKLLAKNAESLQYAIQRSCEIKAEVVAADEREGGVRAILNLGHTYGHAIETEMGYGVWLHGEAVAAGMVMACDLSERLGFIDSAVVERAKSLIAKAGLPVSPPSEMSKEAFEKYMLLDKKVLDGRIRLVLLESCGKAIVTSDFDPQQFQAQLSEL